MADVIEKMMTTPSRYGLRERGAHRRGVARQHDAAIKRSRRFAPVTSAIPRTWSVASVSESDDRAMIVYARVVSGLNITAVSDAMMVLNATSIDRLRQRALRWWNDYGRRVYAKGVT